MKTGAVVLLFLLLGECFFFSSWFSLSFIKTKIAALERIAGLAGWNSDQAKLVKVPARSLDRDQSDEAWYHGSLFDIVKRDTVGRIVYVYLLSDSDEQDLIEENFAYFGTGSSLCAIDGYLNTHHFKTGQHPADHQYLPSRRKNRPFFPGTISFRRRAQKFLLRKSPADVPSPPPRII